MRSAECGTPNERPQPQRTDVHLGPSRGHGFIPRSAFRTPHSAVETMIVNAENLSVDGVSLRGLAQQMRGLRDRVVAEVGRVVVGMETVTHQFLIALVA